MILDGVPVGPPTYNQYRSDIANLFPGLANSNGAVGFFYIDTTRLRNGVHTISWNVFDNAGRGDGIGSQYFIVANTGGGNVPATDEPIESGISGAVTLRRGVDVNREPELLAPSDNDDYAIDMEELGRIELQVGATAGYWQANGERRSLPIGSILRGGVFYWQPGPGFLGEYQLLFEGLDAVPVRV